MRSDHDLCHMLYYGLAMTSPRQPFAHKAEMLCRESMRRPSDPYINSDGYIPEVPFVAGDFRFRHRRPRKLRDRRGCIITACRRMGGYGMDGRGRSICVEQDIAANRMHVP